MLRMVFGEYWRLKNTQNCLLLWDVNDDWIPKEVGKCGQQNNLRCSSPPINRGHQRFKKLLFLVRYPYQSNKMPLLLWRGASQSRIKTSRDFMNWNFNNQPTNALMFNQCSRDSKFFHMFRLLRVAIFYPTNDKNKCQETPQMNCRSTSTAPWIISCTASSGNRCCNMLYNKHAKSAWRPSSREMSSFEKVSPGIKPRFFSQKMAPYPAHSMGNWLYEIP